MLPGTTGGTARCEGVRNTRQTLRPTDTIHTSSSNLRMRMDSLIDEQGRGGSKKREGETEKDSGGGGVMAMCVNSVPKIE